MTVKRSSAPRSEANRELQEVISSLENSIEIFARAALSVGVDASTYLKIARIAYAKVAASAVHSEKPRVRGSKGNVSRIAASTGLTRKEIPILLSEALNARFARNPVFSLVKTWSEDPRYLAANRRPRKLSISGPGAEFAGLVKEVSPDIPAIAVLKELKRLRFVEVEKKPFVKLTTRAFVALKKEGRWFRRYSENLRFFTQSVFPVAMERDHLLNDVASVENLTEKAAALFIKSFKLRGEALLSSVPRWGQAAKHNSSVGEGSIKVGVGVFTYQLPQEKAAGIKKLTRPAKRV